MSYNTPQIPNFVSPSNSAGTVNGLGQIQSNLLVPLMDSSQCSFTGVRDPMLLEGLWFRCLTCSPLSADMCVCPCCRSTCHPGHHFEPIPRWSHYYCDCSDLVICKCSAISSQKPHSLFSNQVPPSPFPVQKPHSTFSNQAPPSPFPDQKPHSTVPNQGRVRPFSNQVPYSPFPNQVPHSTFPVEKQPSGQSYQSVGASSGGFSFGTVPLSKVGQLDTDLLNLLKKSSSIGPVTFSPMSLYMAFELFSALVRVPERYWFEFVGAKTPNRLPSVIEMASGIFGLVPDQGTTNLSVNFPYLVDKRLEATLINEFVDKATHGCIKSIVNQDQLSGINTALVCCLYFKDDWQNKFDPALTMSEAFTSDTGDKSTKVSMMRLSDVSYGQFAVTENWNSIRLPYKSGCFLILSLPVHQTLTFNLEHHRAEYVSVLGGSYFKSKKLGVVKVPKVKIDQTHSHLIDRLEELGMPEECRYYNDVVATDCFQRTIMEIDENGTTAASVTMMLAKSCCIVSNPKPRFSWIGNRPFMLALCEPSGRVMFNGVIDLSSTT